MPLPTEDQWNYIADDFYTKWNIPNCLGAIGGKHVTFKPQQILDHCSITINLTGYVDGEEL